MPIDSSIRNLISLTGRIGLDEMMDQVLSSCSMSYYKNVKDIGEGGDFITSPEISQLFGEMIGLWVVSEWQRLGQPERFTLLELGPGKGTLMRDLIRSVSLVSGLLNKIDFVFFDINPHLISLQKETLNEYINSYPGASFNWVDSFFYLIASISDKPLIVVSNEFFDALPIKQYIKVRDIWYENVLVVDPIDSLIKYDKIELNDDFQKYLKSEHKNATDGAVLEESPEGLKITRELAQKIKNQRGAFLAIDYGYCIDPRERKATQYMPTLQAIKNHKYQPIIDTLGESDLSSHVDFLAIIKAAASSGIGEFRLTNQADFLIEYGIFIRLKMLLQNGKFSNTGEENIGENLEKQVNRLTSKDQMGDLFKVLRFSYV